MQDTAELLSYAKAFSGLTPEKEKCLIEAGADIKPHLSRATEEFYAQLLAIPAASQYIEGRVELLKATHLRWMEGLFTGPFDEAYAEAMYRVGAVHVQVKLPIEFMAGGMTIIQDKLYSLVSSVYRGDYEKEQVILQAVNAVMGFALIIMQQSYQASSMADELDKFLRISGISRSLFANLAKAYKD